MQLRANSADDALQLADRISSDEQFGLAALSEPAYFAEQAKSSMGIKAIGVFIAVILSIGAVFAVANTMYAAVASRASEIGTLRALGFNRRTVLVSFMIESLTLCLAGGLLGCLAAIPLNGMSTGTANWVTFSELAFTFRFGPSVQILAVIIVATVGMLGGLFPALRATRMKIVDALSRDLKPPVLCCHPLRTARQTIRRDIERGEPTTARTRNNERYFTNAIALRGLACDCARFIAARGGRDSAHRLLG